MSPREASAARLKELGVDGEVVFNTPPRPEMGDFSTPIALKLAKARGIAPLALAEQLRNALSESLPRYVREVTISPPGFLNFFLDDRAYLGDLLRQVISEGDRFGRGTPASGKVLVEHTNVNPNKAMHVGHVRNAVLGDTIVRALRWSGRTVEACNYIDDTGVQVVDVVTALLYLDEPFYQGDGQFDSIWEKADPALPLDYACWDIYARVQDYLRPKKGSLAGAELERAELLQARKADVMHAVEDRNSPIARFAKELATRIVRAHLRTASRLNVFYNLLNWESDVLGAGFWQQTFERLKESGAIRYEESGLNAGCWVVPMGGVVETPDGPRSLDKILVRSSGTITYTAKDIAYQLWKFGRLNVDFLYKSWGLQLNGDELFSTAPDGSGRDCFGHAARVINVIDRRQSEAQNTVYECLERLGFQQEHDNSVHLGYDVVELSAAAARELGVQVSEEKQSVSMSGRQGLGVKGDDLIDHMVGVIRTKNPDMVEDAEALAAAAIRYYMLRFATNTKITFDFEIASQTTGESGVYLVYAYARAGKVLERLGIREETSLPVELPETILTEDRAMIREFERFSEAVRQTVETCNTTPLTTYAFSLASALATFYENTPPMLTEADPVARQFRVSILKAFRQVMKNALSVLGITPLERI